MPVSPCPHPRADADTAPGTTSDTALGDSEQSTSGSNVSVVTFYAPESSSEAAARSRQPSQLDDTEATPLLLSASSATRHISGEAPRSDPRVNFSLMGPDAPDIPTPWEMLSDSITRMNGGDYVVLGLITVVLAGTGAWVFAMSRHTATRGLRLSEVDTTAEWRNSLASSATGRPWPRQ